VLAADAADAGGLEIAELDAGLQRGLRGLLPAASAIGNPVDLRAGASAQDYAVAIGALAQAGAADAILTIFAPAPAATAEEVARAVHTAAQAAPELTFASVYMGSDVAAAGAEDERRVPGFPFPEDAARALAHAGRYGSWRARAPGIAVDFRHTRPEEAAAIIARGLGSGAGWLDPDAVTSLLDCYGLPLLAARVVRGVSAAVAAAAEIGTPVALKAVAAGLVRKDGAGGVRLGLRNGAEIRRAAREMRAAVAASGHRLDAFLVAPMASGGVELTVGVALDASFGPVIVCGVAGRLPRDAAVRITPLTDVDAREMVESLQDLQLLSGAGGATPCDLAAIETVLLRLSALVEAHPEVAELDLSPLLAGVDGAVILDARVRLQAPAPARALSALRS